MTVDGERFIAGRLRASRAELGEVRRGVTNLTLRQDGSGHFEQVLMAHVASVHATLDQLKGDRRLVNSRLELVDGED